MTNPIIDNRIVSSMTFAIRLITFLEQVQVCDPMGEEEQEFLLDVAKRLFKYQKATAKNKGEIEYLKRLEEYDKH